MLGEIEESGATQMKLKHQFDMFSVRHAMAYTIATTEIRTP
jgi:hypothetical protein